jgi:hypothetical protein
VRGGFHNFYTGAGRRKRALCDAFERVWLFWMQFTEFDG